MTVQVGQTYRGRGGSSYADRVGTITQVEPAIIIEGDVFVSMYDRPADLLPWYVQIEMCDCGHEATVWDIRVIPDERGQPKSVCPTCYYDDGPSDPVGYEERVRL